MTGNCKDSISSITTMLCMCLGLYVAPTEASLEMRNSFLQLCGVLWLRFLSCPHPSIHNVIFLSWGVFLPPLAGVQRRASPHHFIVQEVKLKNHPNTQFPKVWLGLCQNCTQPNFSLAASGFLLQHFWFQHFPRSVGQSIMPSAHHS
jgi:hypothetical protein